MAYCNSEQSIKVTNVLDSDLDVQISTVWPVSQIQMDHNGTQLIVVSEDRMVIHIYSLRKGKSDKPVQQFTLRTKMA